MAESGRRRGVTLLPVAGGLTTKVDAADAWLAAYAWHVHRTGRNTYACTSIVGGDRLVHHVFLHHFLLPRLPKAARLDVDHINHDSLDDRRRNLRHLPHRENVARGLARRAAERRAA